MSKYIEEPKLNPCPMCGGIATFNVEPYSLSIKIDHKGWCCFFSKKEVGYGNYTFPITNEEYKTILAIHKENLAKIWNRRE